MECTTRLPKTGPMLSPARRPQMYSDVAKLLALPIVQISLTMPDVMLASVPEHDPVMIRVMINVAKFCAKAWGMMKMIKTM